MVKNVNQMIIRQRAGKRLMLLKTKLKEQSIKTKEDTEKAEAQKFVFNLNPDNIEFPRMPVEADLTSIKEKVEAEMPTNFDDMMPFQPIEDLDFEIYKYEPFEIPQMSHYIPVLDEKPKRQGCEHEYAIRGPRGDPEVFIKPHKEKIIEMPESIKKPFDMPRTYLINPHPTLRTYVPYKKFTEVDPEFYLQPHLIPRVIPDDDLTIRANKDLDFESRFLRKNDIGLINNDIPGYVGINTIEKIPLEVFDPKEGEQSEYKRCVLNESLTCDRTLERTLPVPNEVDYPSDEDSGNEEEFEIKVTPLHEFTQELEKEDEVIHKLNEQRESKFVILHQLNISK